MHMEAKDGPILLLRVVAVPSWLLHRKVDSTVSLHGIPLFGVCFVEFNLLFDAATASH